MIPWDPSRFEDKYVYVRGLRVRYWQMGESGPPVVLVHGIGASIEYWVRTIAALSQRYRVYAVDIVGFGRSEKPRGFSFNLENVGDFLINILDALGLESVHWVANSMGGMITLFTTGNHPSRTRSLALVDTAGFGRNVTWLFRLMSLPLIGELLMLLGKRGLQFMMRHLFADPTVVAEQWIDALVELDRQQDQQATFLRILRGGISFFGVKQDTLREVHAILHTLACPTLILWGRQDRILPFEHALNALDHLPGAQLHVWDGAGHLPMLEKPESFNRVILSWLDEVAR